MIRFRVIKSYKQLYLEQLTLVESLKKKVESLKKENEELKLCEEIAEQQKLQKSSKFIMKKFKRKCKKANIKLSYEPALDRSDLISKTSLENLSEFPL